MCTLLTAKPVGASVAITVLGCSKGAEVYSILWAIRKARPDLRVKLQAVDISPEIVDFAEDGIYSLKDPASLNSLDHGGSTEDEGLLLATCRDQGRDGSVSIFERLNESEMNSMFDLEGNDARVKLWIKEGFAPRDGGQGITWRVGDASSSEMARLLGPQDIIVANRFLCHMEPAAALKCLRNINTMVKRSGYIFVSGVDLDIRTRVAKEMHWTPVTESRREIYEGDPSLLSGWPHAWWSIEPFCENHPDWEIRYACVFRVSATSPTEPDRALEFNRSSI
jgi:chemotaxis methyl-accepting protein methylase